METPKMDDMLKGYLDGFDSPLTDFPEVPRIRSVAYKHGWLNGRDDRIGKPRECADVLRGRATMILGMDAP